MFDLNSFRLGVMMATALIVFSKHVPKKKKKEKKPDPQPNPNFTPPPCVKQKTKDPNIGYIMTQYMSMNIDDIVESRKDPIVEISNLTAPILNIREGPGLNYPVIGKLKSGDEVKVITFNGFWCKIKIPPVKEQIEVNTEIALKLVGKTFQYNTSEGRLTYHGKPIEDLKHCPLCSKIGFNYSKTKSNDEKSSYELWHCDNCGYNIQRVKHINQDGTQSCRVKTSRDNIENDKDGLKEYYKDLNKSFDLNANVLENEIWCPVCFSHKIEVSQDTTYVYGGQNKEICNFYTKKYVCKNCNHTWED